MATTPRIMEGRECPKCRSTSTAMVEELADSDRWLCRACGRKWRQSTDRVNRTSSMSDISGYISGFVVLFLLIGGRALWPMLDESGYIYHDKLTSVFAKSWAPGEYKDCNSLSSKEEQPYLMCDGEWGEQKVFKVRFYGQTHVEGKPEGTMLFWKCLKNGDIDPAMTCKIEKEPAGK